LIHLTGRNYKKKGKRGTAKRGERGERGNGKKGKKKDPIIFHFSHLSFWRIGTCAGFSSHRRKPLATSEMANEKCQICQMTIGK
jgi:hypothetical protein